MGTKLVDSKHPQFHMEFSIIFGGNLRETQLLMSRNGEANEEVTSGKSIFFYQINIKKNVPQFTQIQP
jgi:hypothetical protein